MTSAPWTYEPRSTYLQRQADAFGRQARTYAFQHIAGQQLEDNGVNPALYPTQPTYFDKALIRPDDLDRIISKDKAKKRGGALGAVGDALHAVGLDNIDQPWDVLRPLKRVMDAENRYVAKPAAKFLYQDVGGGDYAKAPGIVRGGLEALLSPSTYIPVPGVAGASLAAHAGEEAASVGGRALAEGAAKHIARNAVTALGAVAGGAAANELGLPSIAGAFVGGHLAGFATRPGALRDMLQKRGMVNNITPDEMRQRLKDQGYTDEEIASSGLAGGTKPQFGAADPEGQGRRDAYDAGVFNDQQKLSDVVANLKAQGKSDEEIAQITARRSDLGSVDESPAPMSIDDLRAAMRKGVNDVRASKGKAPFPEVKPTQTRIPFPTAVETPDTRTGWPDLQSAAKGEHQAAINEYGTVGQNERDLQRAAEARAYGAPPPPQPPGPRQMSPEEIAANTASRTAREEDWAKRIAALPVETRAKLPEMSEAEYEAALAGVRGDLSEGVPPTAIERAAYNARVNAAAASGGPGDLHDVMEQTPSSMYRRIGATPLPESSQGFPSDHGAVQPEGDWMNGGWANATKDPLIQRVGREIAGALGGTRTLMSSGNVDFGRMMPRLGWGNPGAAVAAIKGTKALIGSEEAFNNSVMQLQHDPIVGWMVRDHGFQLREVGKNAPSVARAPGFEGLNNSRVSQFLEGDNPVGKFVNASERAYAGPLNLLGAAALRKVVEPAIQAGVTDPKWYDSYANVINSANGFTRHPVAEMLSGLNFLFSPRNTVSQFTFLLDPITAKGGLNPLSVAKSLVSKDEIFLTPREVAAHNLAAWIAGNAALNGFLGLTGAATGKWSVNTNPTSTDAGKVKIGNTRIDTWGGFLPIARLIVREATGKTTDGSGRETNLDRQAELVKFFRNKESPVAGFLTSVITGEESGGQPFKLGLDASTAGKLGQMYTPFLFSDVVDAYKANHGNIAATAGAGALSGVGVGAQSYESKADQIDGAARDAYGKAWDELTPQEITSLATKYPDRISATMVKRAKGVKALTADYFGIEDKVWDRIQERPEFSQYDTLGDWVHSIRDELVKNGTPAGEAGRRVQRLPLYRQVQSTVNQLQRRYVAGHPMVQQVLEDWWGTAPPKAA